MALLPGVTEGWCLVPSSEWIVGNPILHLKFLLELLVHSGRCVVPFILRMASSSYSSQTPHHVLEVFGKDTGAAPNRGAFRPASPPVLGVSNPRRLVRSERREERTGSSSRQVGRRGGDETSLAVGDEKMERTKTSL